MEDTMTVEQPETRRQQEPIVLRSARCSATLHLGDCHDLLPIEADAVVSDPPYGMDWNTDSTRFSGGQRDVERGDGRDDCGTEFLVGLDPGYDPPDDWTVMDVAEDSVRAGLTYRDATGDFPQGSGSVGDDGRHYCQRCTNKMDAAK